MDAVMNAQNKHGGAKVGFPPPLVFLAALLGGLALQRWVHGLSLPLEPWTRLVAGVALALGGVSMVLSARISFLRTGQHPAPWRPSPELIVQGIYRYTRNPMYAGITLFLVGLGVALDSPWVSALAPLALLVVHFLAVRPEEAYLTEKFGDAYVRYKAAVRRYL
jgi:protein-S-isoprenylcysteine O-methyltransferase Ste14